MAGPTLSLVLAYRNREPDRIRRCLESLNRQDREDFELVFVDYGSRHDLAATIRELVANHPFARYLYSDTRGRPWSRARALNVGIRNCQSPFVLTSDVDMVFGKDFVATVLEEASPEKVLSCAPYFLPRGFDGWGDLSGHRSHLTKATQAALGGCQCVARSVLDELGGFDEHYIYWGLEDRDLHHRLTDHGLTPSWIDDRADLFHQWHPRHDFKTDGYLPHGLWGHMERYFQRNRGRCVRNGDGWGRRIEVGERAVWQFVDPAEERLRPTPTVEWFNKPVWMEREAGNLVRSVWELSPGSAMVVHGTEYPRRWAVVAGALRVANRILKPLQTGVGFPPNLVHAQLVALAEDPAGPVEDYHLSLADMGGIALVVRNER